MKALLKGLVLASAVLMLGGCSSMTGTWRAAAFEPPAARADFPLSMLHLEKDHTFRARIVGGVEMTGTWTYDSARELLKFTWDGRERVYRAGTRDGGDVLLVRSSDPDKVWQARLTRTEDAAKDRPGKRTKTVGHETEQDSRPRMTRDELQRLRT
jgi:hypothetical protein